MVPSDIGARIVIALAVLALFNILNFFTLGVVLKKKKQLLQDGKFFKAALLDSYPCSFGVIIGCSVMWISFVWLLFLTACITLMCVIMFTTWHATRSSATR